MSIFHWLVTVLAILVAAYLVHGVHVASLVTAMVLAVVLGIINVFLKPILNLLTLPLNILTLGIFSLVVNALLVIVAAMLVPGFSVDGFWAAFFFSIIVSIINALFALGHKKA